MQTNEPTAVKTAESAAVETETAVRRCFAVLLILFLAFLHVVFSQPARRLASVQTIGKEGAFAYETVGFNATITRFVDAEATEAVVPEKIAGRRVTKIGPAAFAGCAALTEIKLPQGVREIGSNAFDGCVALKTITLPSELETLRATFAGCPALTEIVVAPGNKSFRSVDGVLFSADGKVLLGYPLGKASTE